MKFLKKKKHGPIAAVMDDLTARVDLGFRRPMNLILGTIEAIREMSFEPEVEAAMALKFREGMNELAGGMQSEEQVAELARNLHALKEAFAKMAIR